MLYNAGVTDRRGKVEDGNTVTDFDPEETKRHISLTAALAPVEWKNTKINFIDAPGFFDFVGETTQAYYLADSALILANAFSGVGVGAEKAYKYCKKAGKPMAVLINQIDKEHSDFNKVLAELQDKFGQGITPMQLPIMDGTNFKVSRTADKFAGETLTRSDNGLVMLRKYVNAVMSLKVIQYIDLGTHGMFICDVTEARVISNAPSMTYAFYHAHVKPQPQTEGKKGFVCKICGYVYEGETLPDDFICPLCKHGAADFEPIQ